MNRGRYGHSHDTGCRWGWASSSSMLGMVVGMEITIVTITNARNDGHGCGHWMMVEDGHCHWMLGLMRWSASSPMLGLAGVDVCDSHHLR